MNDVVQTLLISCVPAIVTGLVTYLVAYKNAVSQVKIVQEQNQHDLEKLIEQHKVDIDSLKKQHQQELEKMELEHKHKLELSEKENENNLSQNFVTGIMNEIMKMPEVKSEMAKSIKQSSNKKGGKR